MENNTQGNEAQKGKKRGRKSQVSLLMEKDDQKPAQPLSQVVAKNTDGLTRESSKRAKSLKSARSFDEDGKLASEYKYKQPNHKDINLGKTVTAEAIKALGLDLEPPIQNASLLDRNSKPVLPFFGRRGLVSPYSLPSQAPFASSDVIRFTRVKEENSILYAFNLHQLYSRFKRQANKIFDDSLARQALLNDGDPQHGLKFLETAQVVCGMFESMQIYCSSHFKFGNVECDVAKTKVKQALLQPILNPDHRNVLSQDEGKNLFEVSELESILDNLKEHPEFKKAYKINKTYTDYSERCFEDIMKLRTKGSTDYDGLSFEIKRILDNFSREINSISLHDDETDKAFFPKHEIQLCKFPVSPQLSEPTTSINNYLQWASAEDFTIKHLNSSQLFQQQMVRNPIGMVYKPNRVLVSLTGGPQIDTKLFINHTTMMIGSYAKKDQNSSNNPKVKSLKATVSLRAILVVQNSLITNTLSAISRAVNCQQNKKERQILRLQLWQACENILIAQYKRFYDKAKTQMSAQKLGLLKKSNPILYVQFQIDGQIQGFNTNIRYNLDGDASERLYFRKPEKRSFFDQKDIQEARAQSNDPKLIDVAILMDKKGKDYVNEKINWEKNYFPLDQFFKKSLDAEDGFPDKPWSLLYKLYKHLYLPDKSPKIVELHEVVVFILVKNTQLGSHQLISESLLTNVGSSDFGNHTGITNKSAVTFVKWMYMSKLMTNVVEVSRLHVESSKRVQSQHINSLLALRDDRYQTPGQSMLTRLFTQLPSNQIQNFMMFLEELSSLVSSGKMELSQAVITQAYKHFFKDDPELRKITILIINFFEKIRGKNVLPKFYESMRETIANCTYWRKIPFYILVSELGTNQPNYEGSISTKFMVSLPTKEFDRYLCQISYPMSREKAFVNLEEIIISDKNQILLEIEYNFLLTRLLIWFLRKTSWVNSNQLEVVVNHQDTRLNFAVLIGCAFYTSEKECKLEQEILQSAIDNALVKGALPEDDTELCLEYCGFLLKEKLVEFCNDKSIELHAKLSQFFSELEQLRKKFSDSKSDGFGPLDTDDEDSPNEQDTKLPSYTQKEDRKRDSKYKAKIVNQLSAPSQSQSQQVPVDIANTVKRNYSQFLKYSNDASLEIQLSNATPEQFSKDAGLKQFAVVKQNEVTQTESD